MGSILCCCTSKQIADAHGRRYKQKKQVDLSTFHLMTKRQLQEEMKRNTPHSASLNANIDNLWGAWTSYEDIRNIYMFDKKELGKGHFGSVRRAKLIADPLRNYAVKTISKQMLKHDVNLLKRELEILRSIDHPYIARFYECYIDEEFIHFVLEYCSGDILIDKIVQEKRISEKETKRIIFQVLLVLNHLHSSGICHRDIKPDNIIFANRSDDSDIKMIDFGLARPCLTDLSTVVGTLYYVAPEVIMGSYDQACDYWSLGVMIYVMLSGKPPFYSKTEKNIYQMILKGKISFSDPCWSGISVEAKGIIKGFLTVEPEKRLNSSNALNSNWFKQIHIEMTDLGKKYVSEEMIRRIRMFKITNTFQKEVIKLMVHIFDDNPDVIQMKHVFFYFDYLNTGVISKKEFQTFFTEYGELISDKELEEIIYALKLKAKGNITYTEFIAGTITISFFQDEDNLRKVFRRFDSSEKRFITEKNVRDCFNRFGLHFSKEKMNAILDEIGLSDNGVLKEEDFFKIMYEVGKIREPIKKAE